MEWVTRARPKTDRIACPWLIRRFIDPEAQIVYVAREHALDYAAERGARSFDAPGAQFTHRDGRRTFEARSEEFGLDDPARLGLARIGPGADIQGEFDATPQSA